MKLGVYQQAAKVTCADLGDLGMNLSHMALGMASELSESSECFHPKRELDLVNLGEELGDKFWYGVNWATFLGIKLDDNFVCTKTNEPPMYEIIVYGGQLADIAKRLLAYKASLEVSENKRKEVFDNGKAEYFLTNEEIFFKYLNSCFDTCIEFGLNPEKVMGKNISKLYERYKGQFSEDAALTRNLEREREILEAEEVMMSR